MVGSPFSVIGWCCRSPQTARTVKRAKNMNAEEVEDHHVIKPRGPAEPPRAEQSNRCSAMALPTPTVRPGAGVGTPELQARGRAARQCAPRTEAHVLSAGCHQSTRIPAHQKTSKFEKKKNKNPANSTRHRPVALAQQARNNKHNGRR